jgi:GAF domain-containing protein
VAGNNPFVDRDRRELEVLHRLALSTARSLEFSEVVAALALELTMGIDRCDETAISVWDRGRDELEVAAGHTRTEGPDLDSVGETYPLSETPDLRALLHHADGYIAYQLSDPCWSEEARRILAGWGWRTWLAVPLVVEGRSVGLIEVADARSSRRWSKRDIAFCRTVAAQAALALRNAQLYDDLRQRVDRDPLTNVLNHRAFYERLGSELARFGRAARPLTVMVADLDDFKGVNIHCQLGHTWDSAMACAPSETTHRS